MLFLMADSWTCDIGETLNSAVEPSIACGARRSYGGPRNFEADIFDDDFPEEHAQPFQDTCMRQLCRPPSRKRKNPDSEDAAQVREKKLRRILAAEGNAVSLLHESGLKVAFEFEDSLGPCHQPCFTFSAVVDDVVYRAVGPTKKQAKENAARLALDSLRQQLDVSSGTDGVPSTSTRPDTSSLVAAIEVPVIPEVPAFTSTEEGEHVSCANGSGRAEKFETAGAFRVPAVMTSLETISELTACISAVRDQGWEKLDELMHAALSTTDPCALAERFAAAFAVRSEVSECSPSRYPADRNLTKGRNFVFYYCFSHETFYGISHQKKSSKHGVGSQVLNWLLDIVPVLWRGIQIPAFLTPLSSDYSKDELRGCSFASEVCAKVYEKFHAIAALRAGAPSIGYMDHNNLAAICLSSKGVVYPVVLASGSAVIYRKNLSSRGRTLKDCQAPCLVFRGLKRFLLGQVAQFTAGKNSVFQEISKAGRLQLRSDVGFHLFLTQTPSGCCSADGKVLGETASTVPSPSTASLGPSGNFYCIDSEIVSSSSCRVAEKVEKSFYEVTEGHEKLRIMSSSDKLTKKVTVGIQGALVSVFAHPIFLQTVCMRGSDRLPHLADGLFKRLLPEMSQTKETTDDFPLVCPEICGTVSLDNMDEKTMKPPPSLKVFLWINGNTGSQDVEEFIDSPTGLTVSGATSVVSKKNLASLFRTVAIATGGHPHQPFTSLKESMQSVTTYADLKSLAVPYRKKLHFFRETTRTLGQWIAKCPEEEHFTVMEKPH